MFLGKQFLKEIDGIVSIFGEDFLYFRGFNGKLNEILGKPSSHNFLILMACYENEFALPRLSLFTSCDFLNCSKIDQVLIVKLPCCIMDNGDRVNLEDIFIDPLGYAISTIMKDIKHSCYPNLEIEAVVKLIKSKRRLKISDNRVNILLTMVQNYSRETKFNLGMLSRNVYMSKRKVQYIFSGNGLKFKDVLSESRLSNVFNLVINDPDILLGELALKAGFANLDSANKVANRFKGFDLKTYKNSIVNLSNK